MRFSILLFAFISLTNTLIYADFLTSTPVGPGIIHHHEYRTAGPWQLHILEIDLSDTMNTLKTVKANNRVAGFERTSAMAARSDHSLHRVVGAINGDFYGGSGVTVGAQISQGTLLKRPTSRSVFALTTDKRPLIDIVNFSGQISKQDSLTFTISGVNEERLENQLILYNHFLGTNTGTNQWGTEIQLRYLHDPTGVNVPIHAVVTSKDSSMVIASGNATIPTEMGSILSGHGTARDFLNDHVFIGDTLTLQLRLLPTTDPLQELIGGTPRIIRNGVKSIEWEQEAVNYSFAHDRHPRTAIGFSADSTRVYFFTVDGRQADYSAGMSLYELADYMLEWDIYQGVNLDGGGSTTMIVRGEVASSPSDAGGERSVANALMAISTAPVGPLAYLKLPWEEAFTLVESQLQLTVTGADLYYNPLPITNESLFWSCDPQIGTISSTGLFSAAAVTGEGYINVRLDNIADSVLIHITDIATLTLQPNPVVLEIGQTQTMQAEARDGFGNKLQVEPEAYTWSVSTNLASISASGLVSAEQIGTGTIEASFHTVTSSVPLIVGSDESVMIDNFNNTNNYSLSGLRVDLGACQLVTDASQFISAPTSGRLDYSLTTGGVSVLYLNCNIPISGTPESVSLSVYGDNSAHWIRGEFKNAEGDKFILNFTDASPGIDWGDEWRELTIPLSEAAPHWGNPNASPSFPISWTKIYLAETDETKRDAGTIFFDDLKTNYITSDFDPVSAIQPGIFQLEDHYPNPFNASTRFRFTVHTPGILELRFFSLNGREVDTVRQAAEPGNLILSWEPRNLPSGVYLFRATLANQEVSGKCLLVK